MTNTASRKAKTEEAAIVVADKGGLSFSPDSFSLTETVAFMKENRSDSPEEPIRFPSAQILNDAFHFGLFIEKSALINSVFYGDIPDTFEEIDHVFGEGTSDQESRSGYRIVKPEMVIIGQSARLIEITVDGEKAGLGKRGTFLGVYADEYGKFSDNEVIEKYNEWYANKQVFLRTFYILYLVHQGQFLHKYPFCLSVKGVAASDFGKTLGVFAKAYEVKAAKENLNAPRLTLENRSNLVFQPTLTIKKTAKGGLGCITKEENGEKEFTWYPLRLVHSADEMLEMQERFAEFRQQFRDRFEQLIPEYHRSSAGEAVLENPTSKLDSDKDEYDLPDYDLSDATVPYE